MKKLIFVAFAMVSLFTLSGCGEYYPTAKVSTGYWNSYITIDVGKPYVYKDFDIDTTDGGKDLILHFVEGEG
jgi:uncharacterized lipoprotein YehR (DUF1307 family)